MGDIPCPCRMKVLLLLLPLSCHSLNIDLYYESLCPDSTRFIADQIPETWSALKEDISINFVPYGLPRRPRDQMEATHSNVSMEKGSARETRSRRARLIFLVTILTLWCR